MKKRTIILYSLLFWITHLLFITRLKIDRFSYLVPLISFILLTSLFLFRKKNKRAEIMTTLLAFVYFYLFLQFVFLVPAELYRVWFLHFGTGKEPETVSRIFHHVINLFLVFEYLVLTRKLPKQIKTTSILLFSCLLFFFLPHRVTLLIVGSALLFFTLVPPPQKKRYKNYGKAGLLIFIMAVLITLPFSRFSQKEEKQGSALVDRFSTINRTIVSHLFPSFPLIMSIPGYGNSYKVKNEGRRPILSPKPQYLLEGPRGSLLYLKTETKYDFHNNRWYAYYFDNENPEIPYAEYPISRQFDITQICEYSSGLLYTQKTIDVIFHDTHFSPDSHRIRILSPETSVLKEDSYTILESQSASATDPGKMEMKMLLQISEEISPEIKELAHELSGENEKATLNNINNYLTSNYSYTLDTRRNDNFLHDFLFDSKKGYCLHFSTAFVILARLNGIPARLAAGFLIKIPVEIPDIPDYLQDEITPDEKGSVIITGYSAHLWPEVFSSDLGWQNWEATPPMRHLTDDSAQFQKESDDRQTNTLLDSYGLGSESGENQKIDESHSFPLLLIYGITSLLLLITGIMLIRFSRPDAFQRLRRLSLKKGFPDPLFVGWISWKDTLIQYNPSSKERIDETITTIQKKSYSRKKDVIREEIKELIAIAKKITPS